MIPFDAEPRRGLAIAVDYGIGLGYGKILLLECLCRQHFVEHLVGDLGIAHGYEHIGQLLAASRGYLNGTVDKRQDDVHLIFKRYPDNVIDDSRIIPFEPHLHFAYGGYGDFLQQLVADYIYIVAHAASALLQQLGYGDAPGASQHHHNKFLIMSHRLYIVVL